MSITQVNIKREVLKDRLTRCLRKVHRNDAMLFNNTLGEDCLNHRLGLYLTKYFESGDITVDLEYNRHLTNKKVYAEGRKAIVDIVIHQRGYDANNICVIECKKKRKSAIDKLKIKSFISNKYNYQYGVIVIYGKREFILSWKENGRTKSIDVKY